MENVCFERLDDGLFAIYQREPEGNQLVILSEANIEALWGLVRRKPEATRQDEKKAPQR